MSFKSAVEHLVKKGFRLENDPQVDNLVERLDKFALHNPQFKSIQDLNPADRNMLKTAYYKLVDSAPAGLTPYQAKKAFWDSMREGFKPGVDGDEAYKQFRKELRTQFGEQAADTARVENGVAPKGRVVERTGVPKKEPASTTTVPTRTAEELKAQTIANQRTLASELALALNPRSRSAGEIASSAVSTVGGFFRRQGNMMPHNVAPHVEAADKLPDILKRLHEHTSTEEYRKLPPAPEGRRTPQQSLDDLKKGLRVSDDNLVRLSNQAERRTLTSTPARLLRTTALAGVVGLGTVAVINGLDSEQDPFDDGLSITERIMYNTKGALHSAGVLNADTITTNVLNRDPANRVAIALDRKIKSAQAGQVETNADQLNRTALYSPAPDMSRGLFGPAEPQQQSVNGKIIAENIRAMFHNGEIKEWEAQSLAQKWKDVTKAPVADNQEFSEANIATPGELSAFQRAAQEILANENVGRTAQESQRTARMVLDPSYSR